LVKKEKVVDNELVSLAVTIAAVDDSKLAGALWRGKKSEMKRQVWAGKRRTLDREPFAQ
jgi:hypothetical protein